MSSWVCGDQGAGAHIKSQGQAEGCRALIMSLSVSSDCTHPAPDSPPGRDVLQLHQAPFLSRTSASFPAPSLTLWASLAEPAFPLARCWIPLKKPHPQDGHACHSTQVPAWAQLEPSLLPFLSPPLPFHGGGGVRTENQASATISDWKTGLRGGTDMPKSLSPPHPPGWARSLSTAPPASHSPKQGNPGPPAL